ncbi:MAG TPA: PAS domain S-box protein [Candidatus Paceibacterota bacterium]|nr:PAS domain S-box protein [Verrucomicrobiota bacterium]HRY50455.1 PAS domain S-box protein [Candidatus Paceibacterota bacterium]HRZ99761.1 PAS domain S-box protein [Candidatus Paceibacterota bacterium]
MIVIDLIYNLTLLIAFSVISGFIDFRWKRRTLPGSLLQGFLFGSAAVIGMLRPFVYSPGLIFDGRSVTISLSGLFFGPWAAAVASTMTILCRILQGGPGVYMGVLVILSSALIGAGYHWRRQRSGHEMSAMQLLAFGIWVHLAMLLMTLALPPGMRMEVLGRIGWPVMLTYPLATVLMGKILSDQEARSQLFDALHQAEERFQRLSESTPFYIFRMSIPQGQYESISPSCTKITGYPPEAFYKNPGLIENSIHPQSLQFFQEARKELMEGKAPPTCEFQILLASGETRWLYQYNVLDRDMTGRATAIEGVVFDITERRRTEEKLRESQAMLQSIFRSAPVGIGVVKQRVVGWCNERLSEMTGYAPTELNGQSARLLYPTDEEFEYVGREKYEQIRRFGTGTVETHWRHKDGHVLDVLLSSTPMVPEDLSQGVTFTALDITERKRAEQALRSSLEEKEALLKEVHHRVKNNLQIVSSLLNLGCRRLDHPGIAEFLTDIQSRIRAMALLHETLYASDNLARINFSRYVDVLCAQIARSYASDMRNIILRQQIVDIDLDLDRAIPVGLIIHELVSNALKHAFPNRPGGMIAVQLQAPNEQQYLLQVEDNGRGLPSDLGLSTTDTLGLRLVRSLVDQLDGKMTVSNDGGTMFQIVFPQRPSES